MKSTPNLTTQLIRDDSIWIIKLTGSINANTAHLMWSFDSSAILLEELVKVGVQKLQIDLTGVDFIDSQGLRLLLNAQKEFSKENVEISLYNPNLHLKRLFRIMQFDRVLVINSDD